MMKKKSIVLAAGLAIVLLAGCNKQQDAAPAAPTAPAADQKSMEAPEPQAVGESCKKDCGGGQVAAIQCAAGETPVCECGPAPTALCRAAAPAP
jgi:hypothetical protein